MRDAAQKPGVMESHPGGILSQLLRGDFLFAKPTCERRNVVEVGGLFLPVHEAGTRQLLQNGCGVFLRNLSHASHRGNLERRPEACQPGEQLLAARREYAVGELEARKESPRPAWHARGCPQVSAPGSSDILDSAVTQFVSLGQQCDRQR